MKGSRFGQMWDLGIVSRVNWGLRGPSGGGITFTNRVTILLAIAIEHVKLPVISVVSGTAKVYRRDGGIGSGDYMTGRKLVCAKPV